MDRSIKKAGKKSDSIFGRIKSIVRQSRTQQNKNNQTPEAEHSDIVNHNKKLKKRGA